MQLTDDQKAKVQEWVKQGAGLSEIQKKLNEEFQLALTFMDVRLLVLDLGIEFKDKKSAPAVPPIELDRQPQAPSDDILADPTAGGASVAVEIDRVVKPGALISGTVRFSDGESAAWSLDQLGRLGLNVARQGYRPSAPDLQAFQQELTRLIQSRGM